MATGPQIEAGGAFVRVYAIEDTPTFKRINGIITQLQNKLTNVEKRGGRGGRRDLNKMDRITQRLERLSGRQSPFAGITGVLETRGLFGASKKGVQMQRGMARMVKALGALSLVALGVQAAIQAAIRAIQVLVRTLNRLIKLETERFAFSRSFDEPNMARELLNELARETGRLPAALGAAASRIRKQVESFGPGADTLAIALTRMAADLSAFTPTKSIEEMVAAIAAALRGEFDPLEEALKIRNQDITRFIKKEFGVKTEDITEKQRAVAVTKILEKKFNELNAGGRAVEFRETLGGTFEELKASVMDTIDVLLGALVPALVDFMEKLTLATKWVQLLASVVQYVVRLTGLLPRSGVKQVEDKINDALDKRIEGVRNSTSKLLEAIRNRRAMRLEDKREAFAERTKELLKRAFDLAFSTGANRKSTLSDFQLPATTSSFVALAQARMFGKPRDLKKLAEERNKELKGIRNELKRNRNETKGLRYK